MKQNARNMQVVVHKTVTDPLEGEKYGVVNYLRV
jgi:hypothetical protein